MSVHLFIQHTYNEITIIKFSEFRNELSIMGSISNQRLWSAIAKVRGEGGAEWTWQKLICRHSLKAIYVKNVIGCCSLQPTCSDRLRIVTTTLLHVVCFKNMFSISTWSTFFMHYRGKYSPSRPLNCCNMRPQISSILTAKQPGDTVFIETSSLC